MKLTIGPMLCLMLCVAPEVSGLSSKCSSDMTFCFCCHGGGVAFSVFVQF